MNNDITINVDEIRAMEDNSITDCETIRQISLYAIKHNDNSLNCKVKKGFEFAGLYPHIQNTHNIAPDTYKIPLYGDFGNRGTSVTYVERPTPTPIIEDDIQDSGLSSPEIREIYMKVPASWIEKRMREEMTKTKISPVEQLFLPFSPKARQRKLEQAATSLGVIQALSELAQFLPNLPTPKPEEK